MRSGIVRIVATLAGVMFVLFAGWELAERLLLPSPPPAGLTLFYLVRGVSTAIIMTTLAAWLMLGYRRRYEEKLRHQSEEAQRMRLFFENIIRDAGQAIICLDTQGIVRTWNQAAEEIYGWTADEIIGQPLDRLVPVDLRQSGEPKELMQAVLEKGCVRDFETRRMRKDGGVVRVRITRSALRDTEGNLIGSSAIVSDITSAKEMESRLIHSEKLAAIGQAAASIAHETRNALAGIAGTIQVLKDSPAWVELPPGVGHEVDIQVARIAHIVNDLLSYARPASIHPQRADIHRILDQVVTSTSTLPDASGKRVLREYARGDAKVEVDPGLLEQAFTNVVNNAYQAMGQGDTLAIATRLENGSVQVEFRDSGKGMSDETLKRAFEPFFTTKVRGTGLGLPIVRTIVEAHHGTVQLSSALNQGTIVTFTLPTRAAHSN
jgi:PAS domain S-box-containing protein